ncbi:MAG TPA: hypothetical protein VFM21_04620 [Terriglobia bacterium]|nr:hypothetical protein [Terriglobia bacterium]
MAAKLQYGEILASTEGLSLEEQEALVEVLRNRLRDRRRAELAQDVQEAQEEFAQGRSKPSTPDDLMKEILS